jgi:hypothetical protein
MSGWQEGAMNTWISRLCCSMLVATGTAAPTYAQAVALRGPAPVAAGIDAPARRLPSPGRWQPPADESGRQPPTSDVVRSARVPLPPNLRATVGTPLPLGVSFEGVEFDGHSLDHVIAAGPGSVLVATNEGLALREKDGSVIASIRGLAAFFDSVRQPQEAVADPRVIYDPASERYFLAAIGVGSVNGCAPGTCVAHQFLAVSKRSMPASLDTGDWYFYALDATLEGDKPTARWADFVQLGLNDTVVVLTANMHAFGGRLPSVSKIRILNKAQLVRGEPVTWTDFVDVKDPSTGVSAFRPALHLDRTDQFFLLHGCSADQPVVVASIKDPLTSPTLSFQAVPVDGCRTVPYSLPAQPHGRPLSFGAPGAVVYRNQSLWNAQSTIAELDASTVAGVLWYQIDVRAWPRATVLQASVLAEPDVHYFMPALIVDDGDNMAMAMARSSAAEPASLYYTGRLASDDAGVLRAPALLKAGSASLIVEDDRYGDYFGAAVDPTDGSAWLVGQFVTGPTETTSWVARVTLRSVFRQ